MQAHKITDKERSEWIMQVYFVDYARINSNPTFFPLEVLESIEAFIKLN
jgi:hypothetical protein